MRKMNKKLKETIDFHIKDKMLLRVERLIGNEPYIEGFPISLSEKFLLITCINDFHDEGYTVLRTKDIKKAYSKESIDFYEEMCKKEGLDEMIKPVILDLSGFAGIFSELKNYKGFISVECEEDGGGLYRRTHRRRYKSVGRFGACEYFALLFSEWIPVLQQAGA